MAIVFVAGHDAVESNRKVRGEIGPGGFDQTIETGRTVVEQRPEECTKMNHADNRFVVSKHSFETSHGFVLIFRDFAQLPTRELGDR